MPAIVVTVGSMLAGTHEGTRLGACTDCRRLWAQFRAGTLDDADLNRAHDQLMPTSGTCMVMGTASTMACIAETLGFTLPGAATAPAVSSDRMRIAEATGKRAAEMAKTGGPTPERAPHQGRAAQRLGGSAGDSGSTNALVHLAAIAGRAGLNFDLAGIRPRRPRGAGAGQSQARRHELHGGLPRRRRPAALWRRLKDQLDLSAKTVNGETLGDVVTRWPAYVDDEVIRPLDNPLVTSEAIAILIRQPRAAGRRDQARRRDDRSCSTHEGPALVFDSLEDLEKRIDDPNLQRDAAIPCMVLRNAGPIGAPGMPEAGALPIPKKLGSKGVKDMVRISDARMSGTAFGTVVLHVSPEAAAGGPLALGARRRQHPARRQGAQDRSHGRRRRAARAARNGSRRRNPRAATRGSMSTASRRPTRAAISISCPGTPGATENQGPAPGRAAER